MGKFLTMSSKGQITLPKEMREELGLKAGDELVFSIIGRDILITPKSVDFNDLAGYLGDPPNGPATLDEIDETVAVAGGKAAAQPVRRGEIRCRPFSIFVLVDVRNPSDYRASLQQLRTISAFGESSSAIHYQLHTKRACHCSR